MWEGYADFFTRMNVVFDISLVSRTESKTKCVRTHVSRFRMIDK